MFGFRIQSRARPRDEAEKPFWISYADLMTALMVLFLVVMAVAMLAVTKTLSQRVLCALFAPPGDDEQAMTPEQLELTRALFVVGGYSFNAQKATDDESRRVEMRLQFLGLREKRKPAEGVAPGNFGPCALPS